MSAFHRAIYMDNKWLIRSERSFCVKAYIVILLARAIAKFIFSEEFHGNIIIIIIIPIREEFYHIRG